MIVDIQQKFHILLNHIDNVLCTIEDFSMCSIEARCRNFNIGILHRWCMEVYHHQGH